jgi:hypothetical protein
MQAYPTLPFKGPLYANLAHQKGNYLYPLPFKLRKGKLLKICHIRTFYRLSNFVRQSVKRSYMAYFSLSGRMLLHGRF